MGFPYSDDGEFIVAAHVIKSPYQITKDSFASRHGSSVLLIPEINNWGGNKGDHRRLRSHYLSERLTEASGIIHQDEEHSVAVYSVIPGQDIWAGLYLIEDEVNIPTTAVSFPYRSFAEFNERYPALREELLIAGGDVSATPTYATALSFALRRIHDAKTASEAIKQWNRLRTYFPVPKPVREGAPRVLARAGGNTSDEFQSLVACIKQHSFH